MNIVVYTAPSEEPLTVAEALPYCYVDDTHKEPAPGAITVALASPAAAGNVDNGAHRYLATFVTADGETQAGSISEAVTVADKTVNGRVALTNIPVGGALVTARKLYRTTAGGSSYLLLATIANNTATTYTDNIADASLGAEAPTTNSTADPLIAGVLIPAARQAAETELRRYLITQTLDAYFDAFPAGEILLPPLSTVEEIVYVDTNGDEQTLAEDQYLVDAVSEPARVCPAYGVTWPATREQRNAVRVQFVAGYGTAADVPASIKQWMLMRIKHAYDNRDAVQSGGLSAMPYPYVDGLLDSQRVAGRI